MATLSERFLFLSLFRITTIATIWQGRVCSALERAVEPLDIFVLRIWATLSLPQKRRQNHYIA